MKVHLGSHQHELFKQSVEATRDEVTDSYSNARELVIDFSLGKFENDIEGFLAQLSDTFVLDN